MKNIICFLSGIVAGIAMCLTAAYYLPESITDAAEEENVATGSVADEL